MPMKHAIPQLDLGDTCRRVNTTNHVRDIDLPWVKSCYFSRESSSDLSFSFIEQQSSMPVNVTLANINFQH
jgi:hypothetical protein